MDWIADASQIVIAIGIIATAVLGIAIRGRGAIASYLARIIVVQSMEKAAAALQRTIDSMELEMEAHRRSSETHRKLYSECVDELESCKTTK